MSAVPGSIADDGGELPVAGPVMVSESIELTNVIADTYDAAIDPALWQQALASITAFVGGTSAALFWHDAATQNAQILCLLNEDPSYTRLDFDKYLPIKPFFQAASFMEPGVIHGVTDVTPQAELEQTACYREWLASQGIIDAVTVNLEKALTRSLFLVVCTDASYGMADDRMRGRISALVPHLQRAVTIGRRFDQSKATAKALTAALDHVEAAIFLVNADGAISLANDPARKMLDEATLIHARDNALHAVVGDADIMLREIFTAATNGDASVGVRGGVAVPLTPPLEKRRFAHVVPLASGRRRRSGQPNKAVAALFIRNPASNGPPALEAIATLYKLTAREVRVLDAVLKVNGLRAIAETLGVSLATVKTHLHHIFRKTGTRRQSELVKLIAGVLPS